MDSDLYTALGTGGETSRSEQARAESSSRRERVYSQLRRMVMAGDFAFGQRLAEERIAEQLEVSRTPVREAMLRLHADRLLHRYADGGFYVAEPDLIDLRDLYELRLTLELRGLSRARESSYRHDLSIIEPLRDRWRVIRDNQPEPDPSFVELDESFHVALSRSAGNFAITETLEAVNARIRPVRMYDFLTVDRITLSIAEHLDILEAVLLDDLPLAEHRLRHHIGASMDVVEKRAAHAITQMALHRRTRR
jgi:DNA-binding GntR family transcriptional regulator